MPRRKPPTRPPDDALEAEDADDDLLEDEADEEEDEDASDAEDDDGDAEDDPEEDDDEPVASDSARLEGASEAAAPRRPRRLNLGLTGMGRPSTGPRRRYAAQASVAGAVTTGAVESDTEVAPDISMWPGTADAAKQANRHPSTIKLWRAQGRIRAIQDGSGCWRYHPEDLVESMDTPDATDPGSVLASGMSAIVAQGAAANERLLQMTVLATDGLKDTTAVVSGELKRAYARIAELENKLSELRDKHAATHEGDLKHARFMRRLDQKHELELEGARETSERIGALLTIIGPIAASIGARVLGNVADAEKAERAASGAAPAGASASPSTPESPREVSPEAAVTAAMARLCAALRQLDRTAFAGLRAMLPPGVQAALDDVVQNESDSAVGKALAVIVRAAQNLSDLQFLALRPITPADVGAALSELRELLRDRTASSSPENASS